MFETYKFRNENCDDLFLAWATIKPVTKVSPARWLKNIVSLSGMDTKVFLLTYVEVLHYSLHITK